VILIAAPRHLAKRWRRFALRNVRVARRTATTEKWHRTGGQTAVPVESQPASSSSPASPRSKAQSIWKRIRFPWNDAILPALVIPFVFWIICATDWIQRRLGGTQPNTKFWAMAAVMATFYGGLQFFRLRPRLRRLHRRPKGERVVAEILDRARAHGCAVFHDLPSDFGNIDHVVVGPAGVFAIETKARTGAGTIEYRNENEIVFGDRLIDQRALARARGSARAVQEKLQECFETKLPVTPLVVFVGEWRVHRHPGNFVVDVLAAHQLENYFDRQQPQLTRQEITEIAAQFESASP
jgi:hypothetical protein